MTQQSTDTAQTGAYEGKDFVCRTCGCEIMVKHWGDPRGHAQEGVFLCHCGTTLEPEHSSGQNRANGNFGSETEQHFSQDDFLTQGSGVGGPTTTDGAPGTTTPVGGI